MKKATKVLLVLLGIFGIAILIIPPDKPVKVSDFIGKSGW